MTWKVSAARPAVAAKSEKPHQAASCHFFGSLAFMVRPARIELATFGFVDQRSIQLSYGRISKGLRLVVGLNLK
jgi:hypothetical protein